MSETKQKDQGPIFDGYVRSMLQDRLSLLVGVLACLVPAHLFTRLCNFRIEDTQFVTDGGRKLAADFILSATLVGTNIRVGILILLEHKSFLDRATPEQLLKYQTHLLINRGLMPILVGVLYHGQAEWMVPTSFKEYLISKSKGLQNSPELRKWLDEIGLLDFRYFVLDVKRLSDEVLKGQDLTLQILFHTLKYARSQKAKERAFAIKELLRMGQKLGPKDCNFLLSESLGLFGKCGFDVSAILKELDVSNLKLVPREKAPSVFEMYKKEQFAEGEKRGVVLGKKQGVALGKKEGFREATMFIAQNMLKAGTPIGEICKNTGLPKKDVLRLKKITRK